MKHLVAIFIIIVVALCVGCDTDEDTCSVKPEEPVYKEGKLNEDYEASEAYSYVQIWTPGDCKLEREYPNVVKFYEEKLPKYGGMVFKFYTAAPPAVLHFFIGNDDVKQIELTDDMDIEQILAIHGFGFVEDEE